MPTPFLARSNLRRRLLAAVLAVATWTMLTASEGHAFCRATTVKSGDGDCVDRGLPLFWRGACVGYRLNPKDVPAFGAAKARSVLEQTYGAWAGASCNPSIKAVFLGETADNDVGYLRNQANANVVVFRTTWPYPNRNQVALTTLTYRPDTGEMVDADIEVNASLEVVPSEAIRSGAYDLTTIFAHEGGHLLGLAHSDIASATMFPRYPAGTVEQGSLARDDGEGLCSAYAPDGMRNTASGPIMQGACDPNSPVSTTLESQETSGCNCRTAPQTTPIFAATIALGLLVRRRVRLTSASRH
jgi:MYXO-CTERM domain-containing protein